MGVTMKIRGDERIVNKDIIKDRRQRYGNNFPLISALWRGFIRKRFKVDLQLTAEDTAIMMTLMKVSRLAYSPEQYDTLQDMLNYAWIGLNYDEYECTDALMEKKNEVKIQC